MKAIKVLVMMAACLWLFIQEVAISTVFPMWSMGANTVSLDGNFSPITKAPYSICSGFYGCQRAICNATTVDNGYYVGVFLYNMFQMNCDALDSFWIADSMLPRSGYWYAYRILTYIALVTVVTRWIYRIVYKVKKLKFPYVSEIAYGLASMSWNIYLNVLIYQYRESPPLLLSFLSAFMGVLMSWIVLNV